MFTAAVTPALTLLELKRLYLTHAVSYYRRRDGSATREHLNMKAALDRFTNFAGETSSPTKINRHQVRAWMDQLAAEELTRHYVNACLSRLRRFVRWAADLEYLPISVDSELRLVKPLAPFRSKAKESEKRTPPTMDQLRNLASSLPATARNVLQLSRLTGARPSELLELTNAEVHIDATGARLCPGQHKTAHHGHQRIIPLSPAAIAIVERIWRPLLPMDRLFTGRSKRGHYTIDAFRAAMARGCTRAGIKVIKPYDVRHAVGRHVRRTKGLDAAQALLGHANASTTEIYAPLDDASIETFKTARSGAEVLQ